MASAHLVKPLLSVLLQPIAMSSFDDKLTRAHVRWCSLLESTPTPLQRTRSEALAYVRKTYVQYMSLLCGRVSRIETCRGVEGHYIQNTGMIVIFPDISQRHPSTLCTCRRRIFNTTLASAERIYGFFVMGNRLYETREIPGKHFFISFFSVEKFLKRMYKKWQTSQTEASVY